MRERGADRRAGANSVRGLMREQRLSFPFSANGKAISLRRRRRDWSSWCTIKKTALLLGAHMAGVHVTEMIWGIVGYLGVEMTMEEMAGCGPSAPDRQRNHYGSGAYCLRGADTHLNLNRGRSNGGFYPEDRTAIVTGGAKGIGREAAVSFSDGSFGRECGGGRYRR